MKPTPIFRSNKFSKFLSIALFAFTSLSLNAATLFENFDSPSVASTNNNGVTITYPSGSWFTNGITKPTTATENDRIIGTYSMRMRGLDGKNTMYMIFDKAGAGVISFNYASYSNHSGGEFTVQQSTDGGSTWTNSGTPITVPKWSGTFLTYSQPINYSGNIRFKIVVTCRTVNNPNEQFNIDNLQVTDFGTDQTSMPVSSTTTGVYESAQNVTLTSATPGATIYYTIDGTAPTTSSQVYSTVLNVTSTTKIRTYAVSAGKIDSREEVVIVNIPEEIDNLASLTSKMASSGTNINYFKYTGQAIISHYYTTSSVAAYGTTVTKYAYLQDNTGGISLKDNFKNLSSIYNTGDKVTGIVAQVFNVNNTSQLLPNKDFTVISSGNSINPVLSTIADALTKPYQLVQLNNVYFDGADGTKTFGSNNSYFLREGTSTVSTFPVRIPSLLTVNPDYQSSIIPTQARNIIGIVSKSETSFTDFSLFVRSAADLNVLSSGISTLKITSLSVSDGKVQFETASIEKLKVYSVTGQCVKSMDTVTGQNSISLTNGVYLVKIGTSVSKIFVK
ncbi:MAG: chitobiase/beta-hexosaminidase C-terminal domain-containing protein [Paludibacter sp.]